MKIALPPQQTAFFTKNGYIEFEIPHPPFPATSERDLWRKKEDLRLFLVNKLAPIAHALTGKRQLRLACDQSILAADLPKKAGAIKELLSIQGLALGALYADETELPEKRSPLGILPLPTSPQHILFFRPDLILDWPSVRNNLYMALFTLPNAVYVYNPKDPFTHSLKAFGYQFGDLLTTKFHPLLTQK